MTKLLKGSLFGGLLVFIWMAISWMVLPWHCWGFQTFQNEKAVASTFVENAKTDGLYLLPNLCRASDDDKHDETLKKSPIIFASIQHKGFEQVSFTHYITSLVLQIVGAFLITSLLLLSKIRSYWIRVLFATIIGLLVGLLGVLPNWNWWGFSLSFVLVEIADFVVGWFLAGLAISACTKP